MVKKKIKEGKGLIPQPSKKPRIDSTLKNPMDQNPVWQVGILDVDGPWGWNTIEKELFFKNILPKVINFETMFWKEILKRYNHEVQVSEISPKAQMRLTQLDLDNTESLVSLRLSGSERIWGIRVDNILQILWWDPNHQVYPSLKKHT